MPPLLNKSPQLSPQFVFPPQRVVYFFGTPVLFFNLPIIIMTPVFTDGELLCSDEDWEKHLVVSFFIYGKFNSYFHN